MAVRGVIFDIGGALIWSNHDKFEAACAWAAVNICRSHSFGGDSEALWRELLAVRRNFSKEGFNYRQINTTSWAIRKVAVRYRFTLEEGLLEKIEEAFVRPEAHGSVALPDIRKVIGWLEGKVKLGVVSNTRSHILMERTLEHLGMRAVFDPLVTSAGCGWRKPSPHIFQKAIDAWSLPADQLVMVGDSLTKDSTGAKSLGMRTIWLKLDAAENFSAADAVADTPSQIPGILAAWGIADQRRITSVTK